jgi:hypothetical protein
LNGTSAAELQEQIGNAHRALYDALTALHKCSPNGRDYYVHKDPNATARATAQHVNRCEKIQSVMEELHAIFVDVERQHVKREQAKAGKVTA